MTKLPAALYFYAAGSTQAVVANSSDVCISAFQQCASVGTTQLPVVTNELVKRKNSGKNIKNEWYF